VADSTLHAGVRTITDLMVVPGLINLDYSDVKTVLSEMKGISMMGVGESGGEGRAVNAARGAIFNPLLEAEVRLFFLFFFFDSFV
jgi:cell division protein FtsZ